MPINLKNLGTMKGWDELLANPMILSMMARMGTELDPTGVGGQLGRVTQGTIEQTQLAKAGQQQQQLMQALIQAIAGPNALKSAVIGRDGEVKLEAFETGALEPRDVRERGRLKLPKTQEALTPSAGSALDKLFQ